MIHEKDSSTALTVINILRKMTEEGMIVICSIHQPRSNIFSAFDKVMLLKKGRMAYYGPHKTTVKYFERLGLSLPPETNPADWILDLTTSSQKLADGRSLEEAYFQFTAEPATKELDMKLPTGASISKTRERLERNASNKSNWVTSFWYQLRVLLQRQSKQSRGEIFNSVNLGQIFIVAVVASAVWWQSESIADTAGALFFVSLQQSFTGVESSMRIFPPERSLMIRERSTGSYRVGPYFLAKSMSDIGIYTVAPLLYATFVYWSVGLRPEAGAFFIFLLIFMLEVLVGQSLGLFISTAISDVTAAHSFSFVLILVLMLFGGFYVNSDNIPEEIRWIRYLSYLYYGFSGLLYNELHEREFLCDEEAGTGISGLLGCAEGGSGVVSGEEILDEYGFPDVNVWENIAVLAGIIVGFRLLTYIIMRRSTKLLI